MERSPNFNFYLPSRDVDDIVDINQISENFETIDEAMKVDSIYNPESANAQSGIAVAQAIDTCSPAIVITSDTGKAISIPDSAESNIKGLTGYGESTQDGTPAPDSPVEIVNIENPVINIGNQTVTIPYTFRGLKNPYNSSWVARDELRVGNGKVEIVRNVEYLECTSDLNWVKSGVTTSDSYNYANSELFGDGTNSTVFPKCTNFVGEWSTTVGCFYIASGRVYFNYAPYNTTTLEDWKSFLDTVNMSIIWASNEGAVEDITATEAGQALLKLYTNYPNTSVVSDIDLNITYKADTKSYIDNKITERLSAVEAAILNNI